MTTPLIHLQGKVAIISGASRGIGEAIAVAFADAGAKVMLCSRKADGVHAVAEKIRARGGEASAMGCHTGKESDIVAVVAATLEKYGKIDVLVNNAATNPHFGPFVTVDDGAWAKTFEVNLQGYFRFAREVAKHMVAKNAPGSIINISSVGGLGGSPMQGVYAMTKAAIISMTQTLAIELGPSKIRVNAIAPGVVQTKFADTLVSNPDIIKRVLDRTALGRYAQPDEMAGGALFLASDAASYVTGHTLVMDGGMTTGV